MKGLSNVNRILTGLVGAVSEAWAQLRIGRLRVLLSLVGVAVAVAAMTFVIALGQVTVSAVNRLNESYTGRPGTVSIIVSPTGKGTDPSGDGDSSGSSSGSAPSGPGTSPGTSPDGPAGGTGAQAGSRPGLGAADVVRAQSSFVERYQVKAWATHYDQNLRVAFPSGGRTVHTQVVSLQYGILHHTDVAQGRWFSAEDADDLSPSIIVSQGFLEQLGLKRLTGPVQVRAYAPAPVTYTIVGVLKPEKRESCQASGPDETPCAQPLTAMVLNTPYERMLPTNVERATPVLEIWAGQDGADQRVIELAKQDFNAAFGAGSTRAESNVDQGATTSSSSTFTKVVTIAGVCVMLMGVLGLVNISMVTVRQRIHEIGVRRAFGATSRRIFFSIMLESVVATVVAGVIGIGIAIVGMRLAPLETILRLPVPTRPPFPMSAALIGLAAATGVGALAGAVPALVAVRIRPIDAIRY